MQKAVFDADGPALKQFQYVNIPGWLRNGAPLYDDIYVASGANSIAHVELTDSELYAGARGCRAAFDFLVIRQDYRRCEPRRFLQFEQCLYLGQGWQQESDRLPAQCWRGTTHVSRQYPVASHIYSRMCYPRVMMRGAAIWMAQCKPCNAGQRLVVLISVIGCHRHAHASAHYWTRQLAGFGHHTQ